MLRYREIPLTLLDGPVESLRAKISPEEVRLLAESIREVGLLQPLGVVDNDGRFLVRYGHRRLLAIQWLRLDPVPCMVLDGEAGENAAIPTVENVVRRDLSPIEEAQGLRGLIDGKGYTVQDVARSVGRSESWVRLRLELLRWPEEFVVSVERDEIAVSVGRELVGIEDERIRSHYLRCASESGCTAAQAKMWRVEWELSTEPTRTVDHSRPLTPPPMTPYIPIAPCHVCEQGFEVTELTIQRVCGGCVAALANAKRTDAGRDMGSGAPAVDGGGGSGGPPGE